jgi:hypothetical protein
MGMATQNPKHKLSVAFALVLWGAGTPLVKAQAPGAPSALGPRDCDRACLLHMAALYMDALVHREPRRAPFAPDARFTENDVPLPLGKEGVWATITEASADALTAADTETGNVAWFGTVKEYGAPAYYAVRLRVRARQITEIEAVVQRKPGLPAPFGDPEKLVHDPAFAEDLPAAERRGRERLRDVVYGYFSTVARNDGELLTQFDPDCQRTENGISTTRGAFGAAAMAQGCEAQFRLGIYRINKRIRERQFPIIDEERGVVVATGFFDHDNSVDRYALANGEVRQTPLKWPNSLSIMEAFKVRNGLIYRVEAVFTYVPYFMPSPWAAPPQGSPARSESAAASVSGCDRQCLIDTVDSYMSALVAHDPSRLAWGATVRYTENSVPMMLGDGQWATLSGKSATALHVADSSSGNVAWFGTVEEHGQPAYFAVRLKIADRRIWEVETVIHGQGELGPFGDPEQYAHDPAFEEVLPSAARLTRAQLVALANGYFSTLQQNDGTIRTRFDPDCARTENGISTTRGSFGNAAIAQGCEAQFKLGLYRFDDAVRARRFELVDVERGVVLGTGFIDHGAHVQRYRTTDGQERESPFTSPNSLGLIEAFKIRNGRIYRIEAIFSLLPYGMPSPWVTATGPSPSRR